MIEIEKLGKKYEKIKIFDNVSFQLKDGEGMFIIGASGCGKTTLLRLLAGFDHEYEGNVKIDGQLMGETCIPGNRNIAIVFQEPTLWNHMTVEKNMTYGMQRMNHEIVMHVAKGLEVDHLLKRYPEEISGGQAKRVSLARALLSGKKHLLLDEPLTNVDRETKEIIIDFLKDNYLDNKCILYVTHDRDEVERLPFMVLNM